MDALNIHALLKQIELIWRMRELSASILMDAVVEIGAFGPICARCGYRGILGAYHFVLMPDCVQVECSRCPHLGALESISFYTIHQVWQANQHKVQQSVKSDQQ